MSLINATTAHQIADTANEAHFRTYVAELHASLKARAQRGHYEAAVTVPVAYQSKAFAIIQYFTMFGYKVTVQGRSVTIGW